jgi:alanine racemase
MKFNELSTVCNGEMLQIPLDIEVKGMAYDTRQLTIQSGVVFFAISGDHHDGHGFINEAYDKGVRLFVVEKENYVKADASVLLVENSIHAMQAISTHHRAMFEMPVIGITGSNGKTIVKEWLSQMLNDQYNIVKSPKSYNSQIGVPLSVWPIASHHNLGIFEAGISEQNEMSRLEKIIQPTIGIFTNIGQAHNAGFDTIEQKAREKAQLFIHSDQVIFCEDHDIVKNILNETLPSSVKKIPWKIKKQEGKKVSINVQNKILAFRLKFDDHASIENAMNCAVTLFVLGFDANSIQQRLNRLSSIKMRLEMKQAINRSYVIDDTYNNDLYGLEVALDFLSRQHLRAKKTVILSDLYQTGMDNHSLYTKVNDLLQKYKIQKFIGIGQEMNKAQSCFHIASAFYPSTDAYFESKFAPTDEIVLVKGARDFKFETIVRQLEYKGHGTILEVNLERLIYNLNHFRNLLPQPTKIMVMVKAFAYGGGNFEIAQLLQFHKVDYLGVAYTDEAVELRKNGIHTPIMIMNVSSDSFRLLSEYNLEPEIYSLDQLFDFLDYFETNDEIPPIHIKLETGMNRLGFRSKDLQRLIEQLKLHKNLKVKSIFSHLAGSDDPRHKDYTKQQASKFEQMSETILDALWYQPMRHLVNTSGIINYPEMHYDMVRLGIGLHGFDPTMNDHSNLKSVSTLKCTISQVKKITAGESIGYGRSGVAQSDTVIAIVPIGYADGYLRAFSNGVGKMMVNNVLVPTIGNVCMDMTMVDVTNVAVKTGDEVTIFGESPNISDLAKWINTIPYEILTNISQRVKRVYLSE